MIASKDIAVSVSTAGEQFIASLSEALSAVRESCTPEEYERFKRAVGLVVGTMEVEMLWPLYKQHPDLEPEGLRDD
jgi:hypothetical protein